jgi:hypothetical protein
MQVSQHWKISNLRTTQLKHSRMRKHNNVTFPWLQLHVFVSLPVLEIRQQFIKVCKNSFISFKLIPLLLKFYILGNVKLMVMLIFIFVTSDSHSLTLTQAHKSCAQTLQGFSHQSDFMGNIYKWLHWPSSSQIIVLRLKPDWQSAKCLRHSHQWICASSKSEINLKISNKLIWLHLNK